MNDKLILPSKSEIEKVLKFDGKELPIFPQAASKLLEISRDESTSIKDILKIVETDPGISARVLEIVNSAIYGLQRKIKALSEAVVLLGVDEIKKLTIGMTVFQKMFKSGKTNQFDMLLFWRHCLSVAVLSMEIAKKMRYPHPEEAYVAGLLHDVGKIFFDIQGRKNYGEFIHNISTSQDQIIEKERKILGLGHDDVGAFYCSLWKLPESIVMAVKYHHQRFNYLHLSKEEALLISMVSLSNFICWTQGIGSFDMVRPPILSPEVEESIDFNKIDIIKSINLMNKEVESISEFYNFVFPSANQLHENLLWTNFKLCRVNTKYYHQDSLAKIQNLLQTNENVLSSDLNFELGKPLAKAKTIKEVLDIVMFQIGCIFEPIHWSLLLKDPKNGDMIFSVVVGTNKEKLQGVRLPKGEGVAGYIMETGEYLIVEDVSKDNRLNNRMDKYTGFKTSSIIGTPLKTENKTFGVIELIDKVSGDKFTPEELNILASISEYAAIAIERAYYNQALTKIATIDSLTDLKNRYSLERTLCNKEAMLKRYGPNTSMMIININKGGGRQAADKILKKLALILKKTLRREDDIFRYEGDKFIVLLSRTDSETAVLAKRRILNLFDTITSDKDEIDIKISIFVHSVETDHAKGLVSFIEEKLFKNKPDLKEEPVGNLEENLQPLLEQEIKDQKPENEKAKTYRKKVSLMGEFIQLKTKSYGRMTVEGISSREIDLIISSEQRVQVNDFLDIKFHLDDPKKSLLERRVIVREVKNKYVTAEFHNPPPYSKSLGFYLLS